MESQEQQIIGTVEIDVARHAQPHAPSFMQSLMKTFSTRYA